MKCSLPLHSRFSVPSHCRSLLKQQMHQIWRAGRKVVPGRELCCLCEINWSQIDGLACQPYVDSFICQAKVGNLRRPQISPPKDSGISQSLYTWLTYVVQARTLNLQCKVLLIRLYHSMCHTSIAKMHWEFSSSHWWQLAADCLDSKA